MQGAWTSWALTHAGAVRSNNEDALVSRPEIGLWAVADGAGGHEHGEYASGLLAQALERLPAGLAAADLVAGARSCVAETHQALRARAAAEAAQAGTSVTIASTIVLFLASGLHYACLWAGDSRAYRLRAGALTQLTRDHSLVQSLIDDGVLSAADAGHHPYASVITRAIGADSPDLQLDKVTDRAERGDRFVLCSDGLTNALDEGEIARLAVGDDPAQQLITAALGRAARDNVTAIVLQFNGAGDSESTRMQRPAG